MSVMITRRGTIATEQALAPTITELAVTSSSIIFNIKNNDAQDAVILYEIDDESPDEFALELGAGFTSNTLEKTGLTANTTYTIYAKAVVQGKQVSEISTLEFTTDVGYIQATGGTVTTYSSGGKNYKVHTFTSSGNFIVTSAASPLNIIDTLVIGGGGGGGRGTNYGGGGGAGGLVFRPLLEISPGNYTVIVGTGGAGASNRPSQGTNGTSSIFNNITALGGGGGGAQDFSTNNGKSGGSGGGGGYPDVDSAIGGSGNQPSQPGNSGSPYGFGKKGGNGDAGPNSGGGGGGAGQEGETRPDSGDGPDGGDGLYQVTINSVTYNFRTIFNTNYGQFVDSQYWFAGGGGGTEQITSAGGTGIPDGGRGGGGTGAFYNGTTQTNGAVNTGGGGGAGGNGGAGRNGGSGIVIIRYEVAS